MPRKAGHTLTMRFQAIVLHEAPTTSHSAFQYSRSKVANGKRKLRCLNWAKPLCRCSGFGMIFLAPLADCCNIKRRLGLAALKISEEHTIMLGMILIQGWSGKA